jgi:peptide/nickel transport system permease protein
LTEIVFAWPGLGRLMYDSIYTRDYPVLMGMFILVSLGVILANLLTDIVYSMLDPRIRMG